MVPQGRFSYIQIGSTKYPTYNWQARSPRNLQPALPAGNSWATAFAVGGQSSRIVVNFELRTSATETLALAFWNMFLARTFSGGFDDTSTSTFVGASGVKRRTYSNVKAESFVLTSQWGGVIGCQAVFLAPATPALADMTPTDYTSSTDTTPPLTWDSASFGGITGNVYGWELSFSNNHLPDAPINGTKYLNSYDAGIQTAGLSLRIKEHSTSGVPFADNTSVSIQLVGSATRLFTLTSVSQNNPDDIDVAIGQLYQTVQGLCTGTATTSPLVVT